MTAFAGRSGALPVRWVLFLGVLCVTVGIGAGVNPKYGMAAAVGLAFMMAVLADVTTGMALFTVLSFLDLLSSGGSAVSFMKVAGLLLFASWAASRATSTRRTLSDAIVRFPAMTFFIVAFLAWNAISAVWAQSSGTALSTVYRYLLVVLLVPIMFSALRERKHVFLVVTAFLGGAALSSVYGVVHSAPAAATASGRLAGGLGDPNYEASVLVVAIVFSIGLAYVVRHSPGRLMLALGSAALAFLGLVGTLSRGGLVSFAFVLVAAVFFGGRWRRAAARLLVVGLGAVVAYYGFVASGSAVNRVTSSDTSGRNDIWMVGWRMFRAHPLHGVGAGNFPVVSVHYLQRPGLITAANYIVTTPKVTHNIYLQALSELGIPGLIFLIGIFVTGIMAALRAAQIFERLGDRDLELMARCTILGLIALLAADFFLSDLVSKQLWLVYGLCPALLGLALRLQAQARQPQYADLAIDSEAQALAGYA